MPIDPTRVEHVWLAVLTATVDERDHVLRDECGNDLMLRKRVEELLRASQTATDEQLFEQDAVPLTFGRYQLRGLIGEGGMGEVYDAWDPVLQREVAIKTLPKLRLARPSAIDRFRREISLLARFNHPNVVSALDADLDGERPYLVMERLQGHTFAELVRTQGPLPERKAVHLLREAARGLAEVHALGVVHRDVKPENLFVTTSGQVKVIDLGVGGLTGQEDSAGLTEEGFAVGSADYVAPEQLDGDATPQSDVYALGGTLHFLLTGRSPFAHHLTSAARLAAHRIESPALMTDVNPLAAGLVRRLLVKRPADRPGGMDGVGGG